MNDLNYAFDAYLGDCARRGLTTNTRRKYRETLWMFGDFVDERDCDRITRDHCRRFLDRWVDASPTTMAGHISILRGFFQFLVDETVIERGANPMEGIKRPPRPRPEDLDIVSVTTGDVEKLFAAAEGWQEILCMSVLAYMGPRRTAAATVRRRDVNLDHGTIRFKEKGGKVAVKPLPDELAAIIRAADEQGVWTSPDEYLIPNRRAPRNRERSSKVIYDTVKKIAGRVSREEYEAAREALVSVSASPTDGEETTT